MIFPFSLGFRAILALVLGMALFFGACQPATRIPDSTGPRPDAVAFREAEELFLSGRYDMALEGFERYLERFPDGDKSRIALYRVAWIHGNAGRYEEALSFHKQLIDKYPDHPDTPYVRIDMAATFYRLGDYRRSKMETEEWLAIYPDHPFKGEAYLLLAENQRALKDNTAAFISYNEARKLSDASKKKQEIGEMITGLIEDMTLAELEQISEQASAGPFAPHVLYRIASLHLEAGHVTEAKETAIALVRLTQEERWVERSRQILARAEEMKEVDRKVIGCLLPLTGPFGIYGQEVLYGIQLGMGLFDGRQQEGQTIELMIRDTRSQPDEAAAQVEQMASDKSVLAVIGPLASRSSTAAAKKAQELGLPIITLTQKEGITAEGSMVFRNFLTLSREVSKLVNTVVRDMGMRRFGILYPDNAYGRFAMNLFWDSVEDADGTITAVESYKPKQTDFAAEIKKMVGLYYPRPESLKQLLKAMKLPSYDYGTPVNPLPDEKPEPIVDFDAVFIPDNADQIALMAPQFPFQNVFNVRLLGSSLWDSPEILNLAADYLQGAVFSSAFYSGSDEVKTKQFVERYRENTGLEPSALSASGYDTILLLKGLLKDPRIKTRQDVQRALMTTRGFQGVTGQIAFDQNREVLREPTLLTVRRQKLVPLR